MNRKMIPLTGMRWIALIRVSTPDSAKSLPQALVRPRKIRRDQFQMGATDNRRGSSRQEGSGPHAAKENSMVCDNSRADAGRDGTVRACDSRIDCGNGTTESQEAGGGK